LFREDEVIDLIAKQKAERADAAGDEERFCSAALRFGQALEQLRDASNTTDLGDDGRAVDDVTFSGNGMAQFGSDELQTKLRAIATAGAELRSSLGDGGVKQLPDSIRQRHSDAVTGVRDDVGDICGFDLVV
jgi:hypothetical protein